MTKCFSCRTSNLTLVFAVVFGAKGQRLRMIFSSTERSTVRFFNYTDRTISPTRFNNLYDSRTF